MVNAVRKLTAPLARSLRLMVGRAVVRLVNDGLKMQSVQVSLLADEVRDDVERMQEYGFTSHPHPGAEAAVVCVGGERGHAVVIAVDDRRYRLKGLQQGEVALYTDEGDRIVLRRGNAIEISTVNLTINASEGVYMDTPLLHVNGHIRDSVRTMAADRDIYNDHDHQGDSGGTTSQPNQEM